MTSPLLAKAQRDGREIVNVTPERAGWTHVGFRALRLKAGDSEALDTGTRELCIVVLAGKIDMQAGVESLENLGTRTHVFDDRAPDAVYVPAHQRVAVQATRDAEVALCSAPADDAGAALTRSVKPQPCGARRAPPPTR
jgi:5-deoxy-glucuronate isomerase